jgi:tricorn protease
VNLKTLDLVKVPRDNSNDSNPVWVGNSVYFLSDRGSSGPGPVSLFKYDIASKEVVAVVPNTGLDLKSFQAGPGGLVYEQFGSIHLLNTSTNADKAVSIQVHGELANLAPHRVKLSPEDIQNAALSPTGARAVFEAHGDIFTVPGEKGETRNLTETPGVAERDPSWSPDGKTIAYFSDASGEYQLYLHDQTGFKPPTVIDLTHVVCGCPGRQASAGGHGHLRKLRRQFLPGLVARLQVDCLPARPGKSAGRDLPLLAGDPQIDADNRRDERCQ